MTYYDLNRYANYIAAQIKKQRANEYPAIGIFINRSFNMIAAMLGVLKAGFAYLPLDISYPEEYIALMIKNSNLKTIITVEGLSNEIPHRVNKIVLTDDLCFEENFHAEQNSNSLACILYTSGSTGPPAGVMITHQSILNTLYWAIRYYTLTEKDVSLQIPSCSFTSSIQDIFTTLLSGGILVMLQEKDLINMKSLNMIANKYGVTHFDMVPSLYKEYIKSIKNESSLRFVLVAGEPLNISLVKEHFQKLPNVRMINEYGMAETSSCFSYFELLPDSEEILIGKPIDNMDYILNEIDSEGNGELYITGHGLSDGYFHNVKLTEEKFTYISGRKYLKTGDFVRVTDNGNLAYIGRRDNEIKVNGKRINLNEIDYVIQNQSKITYSITTSINFLNKQLIVSFVKSDESDIHFLFDLLRKYLPGHYLPNYIKPLNEFEYLPNKKINLKLMKQLFAEELKGQIIKNDDQYKLITKIIRDCTEELVVQLDPEKDIREQGIDSITFIKITAELEDNFRFEFHYDDLENMEKVTIKNLYEYIVQRKEIK